jgi:hypothetical protein
MIRPDIYGFYTCGQIKTYRKWEAIDMHVKTGVHPTWHFNDEVYGTMPWHQDPDVSLVELYRRRAQQLRDQYDYLVLWYSGGADSDAALNSFVDNGIFIDEIVSWTNYSATGDRYDFCNGEIFNVAVPKIQRIQQQYPLIKHRILDICEPMVDFFATDKLQQDWIYDVNCVSDAINAARPNLINTVSDWKNLANRGRKIAFITGTDKPRVRHHANNSWTFQFIDMFDNSVTPGQQVSENNIGSPEFFFWSPDSPLIVIKQAHVIKRYLQHATATDNYLTTKSNGLANRCIDGREYWLTVEGVHRLIYPNWQPIPYQAKNPSPVLSQRSRWFRHFDKQSRAYQNWHNGLTEKWNITPDYWKNDPGRLHRGFKQSWSKSYDLGS